MIKSLAMNPYSAPLVILLWLSPALAQDFPNFAYHTCYEADKGLGDLLGWRKESQGLVSVTLPP